MAVSLAMAPSAPPRDRAALCPMSDASMTATPPRRTSGGAIALQSLRAAQATWLLLSPWVLGHWGTSLSSSDVAVGLALWGMVAVCAVRPGWRLLQLPIAVWLGFSPFVLEGGGELLLYSQLITAKMVVIGALATPEMLDD
jgi:hypothetical protein